ncbi:uncharacterized protein LOC131041675 isoform X2 [Cryptomeria japonica]|uniref:uncharacterized protein LOC131041675 isoform X2 n=1 Tax=Cryptomeria japonica TaxID=3369 RepID=UPI0025AD95FB|nr:uncharacterized protein LOC131041675 isoform X2 [Cryptomeria japonica]
MDNSTLNNNENDEIGQKEEEEESGAVDDFVKVNKTDVLHEIDLQQHPSLTEASHVSPTAEHNPDTKFPPSLVSNSSETPNDVAVPVDSSEHSNFPLENVECGVFEQTTGGFEEAAHQLPEEYWNRLVVLQCESTAPGGLCDVYLVGTAHVSQDSCREVQAVIRFLKPQVPSLSDMIDTWRNKNVNALGVIYSWFLAKVAEKLEVFPGAEFRTAFEEAMTYGAKVILGDRPVQITLRRTWEKMSLWHKIKFLFSIVFQAIWLPSPEELNKMMMELGDVDMLTLLIQEMSKTFPSLIETLVHERDLYMSSTILKIASESNSVVAVVGRGHLSGIKKSWKQPIPVSSLLEVPVARSSSSVKVWAAVALAVGGAAIFSRIYLTGKK